MHRVIRVSTTKKLSFTGPDELPTQEN